MRKSNGTPSIVPRGDDQTVYLVVDNLGQNGRVWREGDEEPTDLETVIGDLLSGQCKNPPRVVAFNTAEGWSQDVSADIAAELRQRSDQQMRDVPFFLQDFVDRYEGRDRDVQLPLPMRLADHGPPPRKDTRNRPPFPAFIEPTLASSIEKVPAGASPILQGSTRGFVMADLFYNVVKAPVGWMLFLDGVRVGGVYGTKDAAFEAAMVAASFAVRDGDGVQVSVPSDARLSDVEQAEPWPKEWTAFLKR